MGLIICHGFEQSLYTEVRVKGGFDHRTQIISLVDEDLPFKLEEIEARAADFSAKSDGNETPPNEVNDFSLATLEQCFVIVAGSKGLLTDVMKGFKSAYKMPAGKIIFAMLTDTARQWSLSSYLQELMAEHVEMAKYRATQAAGSTQPVRPIHSQND